MNLWPENCCFWTIYKVRLPQPTVCQSNWNDPNNGWETCKSDFRLREFVVLGGEHTNGKSPTGVIVCHYGSPIMWSSHLQSLVALSTMESEMMATSTGTQLTLLARNVLFLLSWGAINIIPLKYGQIIYLTYSVLKTSLLLLILDILDLRSHFISEQVSRGLVDIIHISGDKQSCRSFN